MYNNELITKLEEYQWKAGKSFPKDLVVAKILKIEKNDQKPFQQAQISLFFNVKSADNLFVITNYKQSN